MCAPLQQDFQVLKATIPNRSTNTITNITSFGQSQMLPYSDAY